MVSAIEAKCAIVSITLDSYWCVSGRLVVYFARCVCVCITQLTQLGLGRRSGFGSRQNARVPLRNAYGKMCVFLPVATKR